MIIKSDLGGRGRLLNGSDIDTGVRDSKYARNTA